LYSSVQEDVEQAIQREYKVCFSLAHRAPIMKTLVGERLQYLFDEALARSIIMGTYNIPLDMDPATRLVGGYRQAGNENSEWQRE
jgi:hypothetical protein